MEGSKKLAKWTVDIGQNFGVDEVLAFPTIRIGLQNMGWSEKLIASSPRYGRSALRAALTSAK